MVFALAGDSTITKFLLIYFQSIDANKKNITYKNRKKSAPPDI
jgi:hypothetical protein